MTNPDFSRLNAAGLNLQAVFAIDQLPAEMAATIRDRFDPAQHFRQLILIGHGGTRLWASVTATDIDSPNPIDRFSAQTVDCWLREQAPGKRSALIYPGDCPLGLQALGKLAGWHHASPFMVGINETWGSWFAYRAVVLSDTDFAVTPKQAGTSPCASCIERPCLTACPAGAPSATGFSLDKCLNYRKQPDSACHATCLARLACTVRSEHRYPEAQMAHAYSISKRMIERKY